MGLTDVIHRKDKTVLENKKDHYKTNPAVTLALMDKYIKRKYSKDIKVVDGCCGEHHISNVLKSYFNNVDAFDLYMGENRKDFLEVPILENAYTYDLHVMNPPFSAKYDFIDHSLKVCKDTIVLLPGMAENYIVICEKYKDNPLYKGKVATYPKHFMKDYVEKSGKVQQGGTTTYNWLVFSNDGKENEIKFEIMADIRNYYDKEL